MHRVVKAVVFTILALKNSMLASVIAWLHLSGSLLVAAAFSSNIFLTSGSDFRQLAYASSLAFSVGSLHSAFKTSKEKIMSEWFAIN